MNKNLKYASFIISGILPILGIIFFSGLCEIFLYNWLWCGFYGSILLCFFSKSKIYKTIIIVLNVAIISFCAFGALMGGLYGLKIIMLSMLVPFYPTLF